MRISTVALLCVVASLWSLGSAGLVGAQNPPTTRPLVDCRPLVGLRAWVATPAADRPDLGTFPWSKCGLSKQNAVEAKRLLLDDHAARIRATREKEWQSASITLGQHELKWKQRHFGEKPKEGWNLYISLHGGGNAPAAVNDQQWDNQIKLYQPRDSLYIAPRAPTNTWNLWHEPHMDPLLDRLIEDAVIFGQVNPNRVYLMGYSAGGDGVYQLAPRMADRWAAASMMAGHPNDALPLGLRNIGFAIHVGALDGGFKRNEVAAEWGQKLDDLHRADADGYIHTVQLHAGRGHWMNLEDKVAVEWMAQFTRNPIPEKIVWKQSSVTHESFYWLSLPPGQAKAGQLVIASRKGQTISIDQVEGMTEIIVRLNDAMVDMEQPVTIVYREKKLFGGFVQRTIGKLSASLAAHGDPELMFDEAILVKLGE